MYTFKIFLAIIIDQVKRLFTEKPIPINQTEAAKKALSDIKNRSDKLSDTFSTEKKALGMEVEAYLSSFDFYLQSLTKVKKGIRRDNPHGLVIDKIIKELRNLKTGFIDLSKVYGKELEEQSMLLEYSEKMRQAILKIQIEPEEMQKITKATTIKIESAELLDKRIRKTQTDIELQEKDIAVAREVLEIAAEKASKIIRVIKKLAREIAEYNQHLNGEAKQWYL